MRHTPATLAVAFVLSLMVSSVADPGTTSMDLPQDRVPFTLEFESESSSLRINSVFLLPGEVLDAAIANGGAGRYVLETTRGELVSSSDRAWRWRAPDSPGLYPISIRPAGSMTTMKLNAFVMVPAGGIRKGTLNGYRIGDYPERPLHEMPIYERPVGFVEVSPELAEVALTPHFKLGQFLCKQEGSFPKYVVLTERLLLKLEHLLHRVNELGYATESFHVMSGFRTPSYNQAIGNVAYSRHVWGDAADIFIDTDGDGVMDDLNADGRVDVDDAKVLFDIADREEREHVPHFTGGLGKYRANAAHGPFVHVDARGSAARW